DAGANDYVTKPFRLSVLLAWLRAHLRQNEHSDDAVLTIGPYTFQPGAKLMVDGSGRKKVRLTEKETAILKYLYRAGDRVIGRDIDGVGAPAARPRSGHDRRQRPQLGKTAAHLVVKPVLCHREKILAAVLPEIVAKPPVIGDAGDRVPLGGTQRVRPDIIDQ